MNQTRITITCTLALLAGTAIGAPLRLKTGQVEATDLPDVRQAAERGDRLPMRVVIQLNSTMDTDKQAAIEASGARILEYIPDNAFVLDMRRARPAAINALPFITAMVAFDPSWKISPDLGTRRYETAQMIQLQANGRLASKVMLFPGADVAQTAAAIAATGAAVSLTELEGDRFVLDVQAPLATLRALAGIEAVSWIEPAPEITFRNNTNRWIVQSNASGQFPVYNAGIRGEGQLIAVVDGQVSPTHCSFSDPEGDAFGANHRKIQAYNGSTGADTHGTHVAGTALGDGGSDTDTRGVAYNARLVFGSIPSFSFSALNSKLTTHYGQGASIHTNSWGNDGTTAYDGMCRAIDNFSWLNDDNLVIFAVTNQNNLRNPENAKNCLAVGASQDTPSQGSFCSGGQGNTSDGRRKPEIYAPGCNTRSSTGSACSTTQLTGTSMAAPAIAGAAALTRQYYTDGYYPSGSATPADAFIPSGTLVKATLLNSAVDMTGIAGYPSLREGWGRVLLDNSLYFDGEARYNIVRDVRNATADALTTGEIVEIPFLVNSNFQELRVTLCFHDAPAATNAAFAPVNNLDLEVVGPGGTFLGNVFASGVSVTGGAADAINNVEMVRLTVPAAGEYTLRVKGTAVNTGEQGYAIVVAGDVTEDVDPGCNAADLAEPFGSLDFFDVSAFLAAYNANQPAADIAAPFGSWDFFDVSAYLGLYNAGCP